MKSKVWIKLKIVVFNKSPVVTRISEYKIIILQSCKKFVEF